MMLWVVAGAGRRVGKTRVAQELVSILPQAVYAKIGHGKRTSDKPANYFTSVRTFEDFRRRVATRYAHCVVESNALAHRGEGDVRIFVPGSAGGTSRPREDAAELAAGAHIRITLDARAQEWRRVLREKLGDAVLVEKIYEVFEQQRQFMLERTREASS